AHRIRETPASRSTSRLVRTRSLIPNSGFIGADYFTSTITDNRSHTVTGAVKVVVYPSGQWADWIVAARSGVCIDPSCAAGMRAPVWHAEAVARLQTVLGDTLRELGDHAKAAEVLERARETREERLGADHPDTLSTLNSLAGAQQDAGRLPEAIALLEQAA